MLPYTPLHVLLMEHAPAALVMTSGNLSEEPLVHTNDAARHKLAGLADAFLLHDRDIQVPCDDSVVRPVDAAAVIPLRRARGYVPAPIYLPVKSEPVLGVGAEQKNTFCVAARGVALLSQHIGDLDSVETFDYYRHAITHFKALCRMEPAIVAHDLHPLYLSTRYARGLAGVRLIGVQHHHAHIAACLAENRRTDSCIGIALDGTGYGPDGSIWGGELLVADLAGFTRAGHFAPLVLPGGEAAVKDPGRMAAAYLHALYGDDFPAQARRLGFNYAPLDRAHPAPPTGRGAEFAPHHQRRTPLRRSGRGLGRLPDPDLRRPAGHGTGNGRGRNRRRLLPRGRQPGAGRPGPGHPGRLRRPW